MVFYVSFNSISVISPQQLTLFMSFQGCTSSRPSGPMSCLGHSQEKPKGSIAAPTQDPYNTGPLSFFKDNGEFSAFTTQFLILTTKRKRHFENIEEKGEGYHFFLLIPKCFLPYLSQNPPIKNILILLPASLNFCYVVKG